MCAEFRVGITIVDMCQWQTNEAELIICEIDGPLEFDQSDIVDQSAIGIEGLVQYDLFGVADKLFLS